LAVGQGVAAAPVGQWSPAAEVDLCVWASEAGTFPPRSGALLAYTLELCGRFRCVEISLPRGQPTATSAPSLVRASTGERLLRAVGPGLSLGAGLCSRTPLGGTPHLDARPPRTSSGLKSSIVAVAGDSMVIPGACRVVGRRSSADRDAGAGSRTPTRRGSRPLRRRVDGRPPLPWSIDVRPQPPRPGVGSGCSRRPPLDRNVPTRHLPRQAETSAGHNNGPEESDLRRRVCLRTPTLPGGRWFSSPGKPVPARRPFGPSVCPGRTFDASSAGLPNLTPGARGPATGRPKHRPAPRPRSL